MSCTCGSPSKANWYVEIVYGTGDADTGTATDYEDGYFCDEHKPTPSELKPEGRQHWTILESTAKRLR